MKPFVVFKGPDKMRWLYRPTGKNRYRIEMYIVMADGSRESIDIRPKESCTITDLMPLLNQELDDLHKGREAVDFGFACYVWG